MVPVEDPTVREVTCVLREWHTIWKKLFIKHQIQLFQRLQKVMRDLIEMRRQLIIGTLTQDQMNERKARITAKIDWGNRYNRHSWETNLQLHKKKLILRFYCLGIWGWTLCPELIMKLLNLIV